MGKAAATELDHRSLNIAQASSATPAVTATRRLLRPGLAVFALALITRLLFVWFDSPNDLTSDPSEYLSLGHNLRSHATFSFGQPHQWGGSPVIPAPGPF